MKRLNFHHNSHVDQDGSTNLLDLVYKTLSNRFTRLKSLSLQDSHKRLEESRKDLHKPFLR